MADKIAPCEDVFQALADIAPGSYSSMAATIIQKATKPPINLTEQHVRRALLKWYLHVRKHEEKRQNLTEDDRKFVSQRLCWEKLFVIDYPLPLGHIRHDQEIFPGIKPNNPNLKSKTECETCFWSESPRRDCPFVRILYCPREDHPNYWGQYGRREVCPLCQVQADQLGGNLYTLEGDPEWMQRTLRRIKASDNDWHKFADVVQSGILATTPHGPSMRISGERDGRGDFAALFGRVTITRPSNMPETPAFESGTVESITVLAKLEEEIECDEDVESIGDKSEITDACEEE